MNLHRYLSPAPQGSALAWLMCLVLLLGAGWLLRGAIEMSDETQAATGRVERLKKLSRPRPVLKPSRAELELHAQWARMETERAFQWYPIFAALERSSEADIELLGFEPDKNGRAITLRGEARNVDGIVDYMRKLSAEPVFTQVYLVHQKGKARAALRVVAFEVRATLR